MNGIMEIYTNREWMVLPQFVHGILPTVMYNSNNHTMLGIDREKKAPMAINQAGQDIFREYEVTDDGKEYPVYDGWNGIDFLKDLKQPFVNVIPIDGPITRNGGACSYGSKDIRDWLMKASDNPYCQGHVLVVNTPGGSAWAKNDFEQGIQYAHSKGMRVIDFIDGMSASAGEYLASLCDEVYVMNPKDQIGCVGVMASFFTMKSGDKNEFTNETYREYYATKSINKNKEIRDIAENDDATLLIKELDELEAEFRADMKKAFPNATDEHLDGKMFDAKDVMGILVDGQMMLGDVIARVFALADGSEKPIERTASRKIGKRAKVERIAAHSSVAGAPSAATPANILSTQNTDIMKEKFPKVFALLGVESCECNEEGSFLNAGLLQTLEEQIGAMQQANADAKALADQLTAEKDALTQQVADLTAQMETAKADHEKALNDANEAHAAAIEEKDKALADMECAHKAAIEAKDLEIATLTENAGKADEALKAKDETIAQMTTDMEGQKAALETAQQTLAERDQQITDLNAQIEELSNDAGHEPAAGASPQNNGEGVQEPAQYQPGCYVYNNDLTFEENAEAEKLWNKEHGINK